MKWIIATRNQDKFREIKAILNIPDIEFTYLEDYPEFGEIVEDKYTLKENAIKKAEEVYHKLRYPTLSDDSGLIVDVLDGLPGVFSSRFAGENASYEDNRKKLLDLLKGVPFYKRRARFVCIAVAINRKGITNVSSGEVWGFITEEDRGQNGFGYDPVFLYPPLGRTFAEVPEEIKNRLSHRKRAFDEIRNFISRGEFER